MLKYRSCPNAVSSQTSSNTSRNCLSDWAQEEHASNRFSMSAETTWSISFPFSLDHIVSTEKTECMCTPSLCGPRNIFHPPSTTWPGLASRASIDAVFGQDMMQNSPPSPTTTSPLCCRAHQTDTDRGIPLQRNWFRQTRPIVRIKEQASRLVST